jgi:magnesium chelatase family protein
MLAKLHSFGILGIDAYPVEIEVDVSRGLPCISIVGLPDSAIKESKERVRSSIKNSGFDYPADKITVNLAPANVKKGVLMLQYSLTPRSTSLKSIFNLDFSRII